MSSELNIEDVKQIANKVIKTLENKNKLYGNSLFYQQEFGIYVRMFDKFRRISNIIDRYSEKYPNYTEEEKEVIANSLIDIVGYALSWISLFLTTDSSTKELESKL